MEGGPAEKKRFARTITVQEGGVLPLAPELLEALDIKGGDYVHLKARKGQLELRKLAVKLVAQPPSPHPQAENHPPEVYP